MPSSSAKQHRFMQAVAHSPSFAKKAGVSQSVGKDFSAADKGKTFNKGDAIMMKKGGMHKMPDGKMMKDSDMKKGGMPMKGGKPAFMKKFAKAGSIRRMADGGMTAPMAPQPPVDPRQLAARQAMQNQGAAPMAPPAPGMKKGGGIESRGKTKGTVIRMASGGPVSARSVSARADGIAQRGKTKFKMC